MCVVYIKLLVQERNKVVVDVIIVVLLSYLMKALAKLPSILNINQVNSTQRFCFISHHLHEADEINMAVISQ